MIDIKGGENPLIDRSTYVGKDNYLVQKKIFSFSINSKDNKNKSLIY